MDVQIDPHTLERAGERGASEAEIKDTIASGTPIAGKRGREGRAKVYDFGSRWRGRLYPQKRVEVYFVLEGARIITVNVYVFFGAWPASPKADPLVP